MPVPTIMGDAFRPVSKVPSFDEPVCFEGITQKLVQYTVAVLESLFCQRFVRELY